MTPEPSIAILEARDRIRKTFAERFPGRCFPCPGTLMEVLEKGLSGGDDVDTFVVLLDGSSGALEEELFLKAAVSGAEAKREGEVWESKNKPGRWFTLKGGRVRPAPNPNKVKPQPRVKGPTKAAQKKEAKTQAEQAKTQGRAKVAEIGTKLRDGAEITYEDAIELDANLKHLSKDEVKALNRVIGAKLTATKAKLIDQLVTYAKNNANVPEATAVEDEVPEALPVDEEPVEPQPVQEEIPEGFAADEEPVVEEPAETATYPKQGVRFQDGRPVQGDTSTSQATEWLRGASESEVSALHKYTTGDYYEKINQSLRDTGLPPSKYASMNEDMQRAFDRTPIFDEPIQVWRSIKAGPGMRKFLELAQASHESGELLTHGGYASTTAVEQSQSKAPVLLKIKAIKGIDLKSVSRVPNENEVLLNHGSKFKVVGIKEVETERGTQHQIELEQVS